MTDVPDDSAELTRPERLAAAARHAKEGRPVSLTVRELLGWWEQRRRGSRVSRQIEEELAAVGLTTYPNFRKVWLDATVELVRHEPAPVDPARQGVDADDVETGLTVGNLLSPDRPLEWVAPNATVEEAITKMLVNDYSQLAVLNGPRNLRGAITWQSIARAYHNRKVGVAGDMCVSAQLVSYDEELLDVLPVVSEHDFVFVKNETNLITGIVTAADVVNEYGDLATPFLLIGQLDQLLRQVMRQWFDVDTVRSVCGGTGLREIDTHDDLSFGHYQAVLGKPECWEKLGWPLDRKVFTERLAEIREVRNDIMHFNPDPLPTDLIAKLRSFIQVVRECAS